MTGVISMTEPISMIEESKRQERAPARKSGRLHPICVAIAGGDEAQRGALTTALNQITELEIEFVGEDEVSAKRGSRAIILMLILDSDNSDTWRHELRKHNFDQRFSSVIALVNDDSPRARAALQAGVDDVLGMPPIPEQAYHTLFRMSELSHRHEGARQKIVCSLVSVSGGVGVSHLTVSLGLAMHRLFEKRIGIVELDLQAAPLTVMLNQDPEHTISELADPTSSIDSIRLESVLCKHDSGLYWLAASKRIEEAELISAATVEATLKVLRELFDVVLVDCGTHLAESSIVAWERSDHLLYILDQTVTGIRAAQRFLSLYQRLGLRDVKPSFVLNRYVASSPITLERLENALGQPIYATLPRDDKSFSEQQVTGQDFWQIRAASALRESLGALARKLRGTSADDDDSAPRRSLLGKLFGALGARRSTTNGSD
jgi:pilus assembly protein CpaE